jgi:hypothetical protein
MPYQKIPPRVADLIDRFDELSDDCVVPSAVTAAIHSVSIRTVLRRYPSIRLAPNRIGQRVGDIRKMSRGEKI